MEDRVAEVMALESINQSEGEQKRIQSFSYVIGAVVCVFVCGGIGIYGLLGSGGVQGIELEGKINPNIAPLSSLVRLGGIGTGRAGAIVAYREQSGQEGGEGRAFQNCGDLNKVRGVGPRTVESISEWLKFE